MTRFSWLSVISAALLVIAAPIAIAQMIQPTATLEIAAGYFDPHFREQWRRQHLGVDLAAPVGANVVAPVAGEIITNRTSRNNAANAYLVIRTADGVEHVLGHISSPLEVGAQVTAGQVIGTVSAALSNSPLSGRNGVSMVHWGVNRLSVEEALGADWEWDRAPLSASRQQAERRGWVAP